MEEEKTKTKPKKLDPWELDDKDREIMKIIIEYPGIPRSAIAKKVNLHFSQVTARIARPAFQRSYEDVTQTADAYMEHVTNTSVRRLHTLVRDPDKKIALQAIKLALQPMLNKHEIKVTDKKEIIFRTKIGDSGQLMQEVIEINVSDIKPSGFILPAEETEEDD